MGGTFMSGNSQKIIPHLWFDDRAEEAAKFYTSMFENSKIGDITRYGKEGFDVHRQPEGKIMTLEFYLAGYKFIGLNAGPLFDFTPAISFFVTCEEEAEVDTLWRKLTEGGSVLIELDKYEWSQKYGWVKDKFGLTWQISLGNLEDVGQKITPSLMYVSENGRAEEALKLYTSVFGNSDTVGILHYGPGQDQPEGSVMHAQFRLNGEVFMAMDSSPKFADFTFNEALSLLISCESQEEVDYFWEKLSEEGEEGPCGWLKDKFGVSWQVHPVELGEMLKDPDAEKVARVTKAFLGMKKFDIEELRQAFEGKQIAI
jgi:predicted 3-demethylubiquinone-9 3-methyltransferase (glyoxalase superfamily)